MEAERKFTLKPESNFSNGELGVIKNLFEQMTGSVLPENRINVFNAKVRKNILDLRLDNLESYLNHLSMLPPNHIEWSYFVDLFKTQEKSFFQASNDFESIVTHFIPQWLRTGSDILKIWTATDDEGQHAFTLALILNRHLPAGKEFKILATFPQAGHSQKASNGVFEIKQLSKIPADYHQNNLTVGVGEVSGWFCMSQSLKNKITFKQDDKNPVLDIAQAEFDLVFFNNELIYPVKKK